MAALNSVSITMPPGGIATFAGILMVAGEVLAGLAICFALQIGYSAAFVAGEVISNAMGLGFASMSDPQSGQSRSEEHTSELQSLMRISYAVFCLKKNNE